MNTYVNNNTHTIEIFNRESIIKIVSNQKGEVISLSKLSAITGLTKKELLIEIRGLIKAGHNIGYKNGKVFIPEKTAYSFIFLFGIVVITNLLLAVYYV